VSLEHSPTRQGKAGVSDPSYTVGEFCAAERISRSMAYKLWTEGKGPRFYWAGAVRRITHQARLDWHREREAQAATETAA
jgi:hypothetical protein